ncbi:hypothetical protein E4U52_006826 [Claviceps spartinae]|nr:hypothetical protein E4U52_006826 [Claviceps spartinae]
MGSTERSGRRLHYQKMFTDIVIGWTEQEEETLLKLRKDGVKWAEVAANFPGKTVNACQKFYARIIRVKDKAINWSVASLYVSNKATMWEKIAAEMKVPWKEAEVNHWSLGKEWMEKRAADESFLTREERFQCMPCVGLPPLPVIDTDEQGNLLQQYHYIRFEEWSGTETEIKSECIEAGLNWTEVAKRLPGRTAEACEDHYCEDIGRAGGWPPELQTELSRLYQSSKSEMWAEFGEQLGIPWQSAENIHWSLGEEGIKLEVEAGVPQTVQPAANLAPSQVQDDEQNYSPSKFSQQKF